MKRSPLLDFHEARRLDVLEAERDALPQLEEERYGPLLREAQHATALALAAARRHDHQLLLEGTLSAEGTDRWPASDTR